MILGRRGTLGSRATPESASRGCPSPPQRCSRTVLVTEDTPRPLHTHPLGSVLLLWAPGHSYGSEKPITFTTQHHFLHPAAPRSLVVLVWGLSEPHSPCMGVGGCTALATSASSGSALSLPQAQGAQGTASQGSTSLPRTPSISSKCSLSRPIPFLYTTLCNCLVEPLFSFGPNVKSVRMNHCDGS